MTYDELKSTVLFQVAIVESDLNQAQTSANLDAARSSLDSIKRQLEIMRTLLVGN